MPKLLILLAMGVIAISNATADVTEPPQTHAAMKVATITKMYEQDINNQGMDNPVVLQQYANPDLQAAMKLEQDYFDKEQISCHIGYDVLWNSQDPDYEQEKEFSITEQGLVKISLAQGSNVYYDLSCDCMNKEIKCQVADVIMDEDGASLREYLLETCR
ncbi:hypothetical protein CAN34_05090 [Psychrobacter sp. DAB_AL32B]|nr:hypothetical protein CAN34_05090 [Psychrobacter sp. DAB_AL32B]